MRMIVLPPEDLAQTLGALYTFRHKIRELILLGGVKDEEQKRIGRFAATLRRYADSRKLPWKSVRSLPFDDTSARAFDDLRKRFVSQTSTLSVLAADTDTGTALTAARHFADTSEILAYDAYDNRLTLFGPDTLRHVDAESMPLEEYCAMLGYRIEESLLAEELIDSREHVKFLFTHEKEFSRVRMRLLREERVLGNSGVIKSLEALGIVKNGMLTDFHAQNRIRGGLFEEYIFWLCHEMGFDDIRMGCKVDFTAGENLSQPIRNEFDILFIKNNRIGTVECKYTRDNFNARKFLYQYDSVVDYFGRTARAILLNLNKEDEPNPRTDAYMHTVLRRSRFGNVRILSGSSLDTERLKTLLRWAAEEGINLV